LSWGGLAFEAVCLKHVNQIKKGLGISGMSANSSSWRNENAQIDLVINRGDNCINLCEMKFSTSEYTISKSYKDALRNKKNEFVKEMATRKNVFITMVTTFGVKENSHSQEVMDNQLTINNLFEKE